MTEHARLVITAGEPAGIGPDVVLGALQSPFDAQLAVVGDVQVLEQRAMALDMDLQFTLLQPDTAPPPHAPGKVSVYHTSCASLRRMCDRHSLCRGRAAVALYRVATG